MIYFEIIYHINPVIKLGKFKSYIFDSTAFIKKILLNLYYAQFYKKLFSNFLIYQKIYILIIEYILRILNLEIIDKL